MVLFVLIMGASGIRSHDTEWERRGRAAPLLPSRHLCEGTCLKSEQRDEFGRSVGYICAKNGATQQTVATGYAPDGRIASAGFMHGGVLRNFTYGYLPGSNLMEKLVMPNDMTYTQSYEAQRDLLI